MNISTDNSTATSQQSPARSTSLSSAGRPTRRAGAEQVPEGANAAPKPWSPGEQPERPPMRAHPTASTDDSLQRLPESVESGRQRFRPRKGPASLSQGRVQAGPEETPRTIRCPYDPPLVRQRDLDVLA